MDIHSTHTLRSGSAIPVIGLGTWQLTEDTADKVAYAIELGYPLIDTSSDYGTQPGIGKALDQTNLSRNKIYIVSKVEEIDNAYDRAVSCTMEMGIACADLMLIHRPPKEGAGIGLWNGLVRARAEGYTTDIGVSNYSVRLLTELINERGVVPVVNQIEWSPFGHSPEMKSFCNDHDIVIMAYSPLTRGKRPGDKTLTFIGESYGKSPAQVILRWNLQHGVIPISKASSTTHMEENIDVFDFSLSDDDMNMLDNLNEQYSAFGSLQYL